MALTPSPLNATQAWSALPSSEWSAAHAAHLLRRTGWTARPVDVARAVQDGLEATLDRLFPRHPPSWPAPPVLAELTAEIKASAQRARTLSEPEQRKERNQLRQRFRDAGQTLTLDWLQHARSSDSAAFSKWVLFLSDVYVTSEQKVKQVPLLYDHQRILREHALGSAPVLTKAVSRSPAMIVYLDLQQSKAGAPNENFARELFELFVLGEGHYSENDIKEAARAFTGYRQRFGEFGYQRRQADTGSKTIFGATSRFDGDDVIDLAYRQPTAATFLPAEMARFYLSQDPLPVEWITALGKIWRAEKFNLRQLALTFFGSQAFYAPQYRGNAIKSPVQFYLGLLQDLDLDPLPVPRFTLNALRGMGQQVFDPPNVRGWVGGRQWINSTTLAARRQTSRFLVEGLPERLFNADETAAIERAREAGHGPFTLPDERLRDLRQSSPRQTVQAWCARWLPTPPPAAAIDALAELLTDANADDVRTALITLLQSPDYNLC